jgi:C4-dicarboxylate-specific signal transduction histidine kinase
MIKSKKYTRNSAKLKAALSYRKLNKPVEAKKLILEILNDQPDFAPALSEMGEIFTLEGDFDKAIFYFKKKLDVLPDDQSALKSKGVMHRLKGRIEGAIGGFEKVPTLSRQKLIEKLRKKDAQLIAATEVATANALLTSFAHQVGNPLQIIQSIIYRLNNQKKMVEDDVRKDLGRIRDNADRIYNLIKHQNELVRSRPKDNKYFDIVEVILKAFEPFEEQLTNHGIKRNLTDLEGKENTFWVFGNPFKVEQLFINLIANARDALDSIENPEIKIMVKTGQPKKNDIVIHFVDNGNGMPKDVQKQIFHSPFTTKDEGTGLGLLLCHNVINQMDGKINVKSKPKKGTKLIITLPNKGDEHGKT